MRIMVGLTWRSGSCMIGGDFVEALRALGHDVVGFDYSHRWQWRCVPKVLRGEAWQQASLGRVNRDLLAALAKHRTEVLLLVKGEAISLATVQAAQAGGVKVCGYWVDDPAAHGRGLNRAVGLDAFFTMGLAQIPSYLAHGVLAVGYLQQSVSLSRYHPIEGIKRDIAASFVGACSGWRKPALLALSKSFPIQVYGPGWGKAGLPSACVRPPVYGATLNEVINRSQVNLNLHTWFGQGDAMNLRLYEVPATGAFLLSDYMAEIDLHYRIGQELDVYRTVESMGEKLEYWLSHPAEREEVAAAGHAAFLAHQSYAVRAKQLEQYLIQVCAGVTGRLDAGVTRFNAP